ncbi:MAG: hypothetical protein JSS21_06655 [Proteobacteria bacterium]|nr:hypothetical protein [Pseudomonadota bacterium]
MNAKSLLLGGALVMMLVGGALATPRIAIAADAIAFTPGNPWAQTVGTISKSDHYHDYSVHATGGKTLKINLISRNPNLYFRVTPANSGDALVDTQSNGETSWSTQPATDTDYTVRVYAEPESLRSGDESKFALQVGMF